MVEWPLGIRGSWIIDARGRKIIMKGLNLAGTSKLPSRPDGSSYRPENLVDPQCVSFVGRPFPIEEADDHYARIAGWGFRFLRFLISWEAVEHEGPGIYDREYLDYLEAVVAKAADHDLGVWIDPHQDAWSRWTGGDGAPAWTLEIAGMDLEKIAPTGSAVVHALFQSEGPLRDQIHRLARAREKSIPLKESFTGSGDRDAPLPPRTFPSMIWPTNYTRYACATMFSLFFGGRTYAPSFLVQGRNIQDYLQHMLEAARLAQNYVNGMSRADFLTDRRTQQAVVLNLITIGEVAARLLSEYPEIVAGAPNIPWRRMRGMRNRMAHGYSSL